MLARMMGRAKFQMLGEKDTAFLSDFVDGCCGFFLSCCCAANFEVPPGVPEARKRLDATQGDESCSAFGFPFGAFCPDRSDLRLEDTFFLGPVRLLASRANCALCETNGCTSKEMPQSCNG
jgi:hypothetical protein